MNKLKTYCCFRLVQPAKMMVYINMF